MSEQLLSAPEKMPLLPEHGEQNRQPERDKTEHSPESDPIKQSVEALQQAAEAQAIPSENVQQKAPSTAEGHTFGVHQQLKSDAYSRTLQRVRHHLSMPERGLSKVIHNPTVEAVSGFSSRTVGRSTGLLVGAIFAFIGSAFLLYSSKRYGYTYNYSVLLLLFALGYTLSTFFELVAKVIRRK